MIRSHQVVIGIGLVAMAIGCGRHGDRERPAAPTAEQRLADACAFLWSKQSEDGRWPSETYGLLRSGQALTPFVLHTLLSVPESIAMRPEGGVERALQYLRDTANTEGAIGLADPDVLEYPNYATAYALRCFLLAGTAEDRARIDAMRDYLRDEQFAEHHGFDTTDAAYGGWGFGGDHPDGQTGHMDLAHTRRVLQSLADAGGDAEAFARAERFLRYVQRHPSDRRPQPAVPWLDAAPQGPVPYDGGFYFSPIELTANKALSEEGEGGPYFRSYATATCDGLLALLAAGVDPGDERIQAARQWLDDHASLEFAEGIPEDTPEPWRKALFYYHLAARSEVYAALGWPEGARDRVVKLLAEHQRDDGSFTNPWSTLQKEDDPLVATSMAVLALSHATSNQKPGFLNLPTTSHHLSGSGSPLRHEPLPKAGLLSSPYLRESP